MFFFSVTNTKISQNFQQYNVHEYELESLILTAVTDDIVSGLANTGTAVTTNSSNAISAAIAILCSRNRVIDHLFISSLSPRNFLPRAIRGTCQPLLLTLKVIALLNISQRDRQQWAV